MTTAPKPHARRPRTDPVSAATLNAAEADPSCHPRRVRTGSRSRASDRRQGALDAGSRSLYAADASNYRQVPIGVVLPRTTQEVIKTVELCRHHGGAECSRAGAGTSLCGQSCNAAVVIDFSNYLNRSVFRDEFSDLFAGDEQAKRLSSKCSCSASSWSATPLLPCRSSSGRRSSMRTATTNRS